MRKKSNIIFTLINLTQLFASLLFHMNSMNCRSIERESELFNLIYSVAACELRGNISPPSQTECYYQCDNNNHYNVTIDGTFFASVTSTVAVCELFGKG